MEPKMTSSLRHNASRRGFTLVELLVVIGMIVLLISILLPAVHKAYLEAQRNVMAADLQVISGALEAYKHDFGDYPRMSNPQFAGPNPPAASGAALLCWALVAPGPQGDGSGRNPQGSDGADGPGFRIRGTQGKVAGPYLPSDRFLIGTATGGSMVVGITPPALYDDTQDVLADRTGHIILYFPASRGVQVNNSNPGSLVSAYNSGTLPASSVFNYQDNSAFINYAPPAGDWLSMKIMQYRLNILASDKGGLVANPQSTPIVGPYLLWSAGPDGFFGTDDDLANDGAAIQLNGPVNFDVQTEG